MKHKLLAISQEAIDFQSGKFYEALIREIEDIRTTVKKDRRYSVKVNLEGLASIIKKHTDINVVFQEGDPAVMPPLVNRNHIFYDKELFSYLEEINVLRGDQDISSLFKKHKQAIAMKGGVDLSNSRVTGVFSQMQIEMYMPYYLFATTHFTAEESAAIILHEVGHVFTYFEFCIRATSTNFALQVLNSTYNQKDEKNKEVVLTAMRMNGFLNENQHDQILKTKNKQDASIVFFDSQIENTVSELGASVYDSVGCEYLADQFSTRHGAGLALVSALAKIGPETRTSPVFFIASFVIFVGLANIAGVLLYSLFLGVIVGGQNKTGEKYDSDFSRFSRIKMQLIEQLKSKKMDKTELQKVIDAIDSVESFISKTNPELDLLGKLAYIFKPSYRAAHNQEKLQKFLESMTYNPLFVEHKKLGMI